MHPTRPDPGRTMPSNMMLSRHLNLPSGRLGLNPVSCAISIPCMGQKLTLYGQTRRGFPDAVSETALSQTCHAWSRGVRPIMSPTVFTAISATY
jgi:hypothetical protein